MRASIDLGTNTCLLLIAEWDHEKKSLVRVVGDFAKIVRLGEGVDQRKLLQPQAMDRTLSCLRSYSEKIKELKINPQDVVCVATSQARDAVNSQEFFARVQDETGFIFRVLSGVEEGRATFLGSLAPEMNAETSIVVDIGGGSTELISNVSSTSIDIGSVRFTERFFKSNPVSDQEFWACQDEIDENLLQSVGELTAWRGSLKEPAEVVAVAGTATTLAAWHLGLTQFDSQKVDGLLLTCGDVHRMVEELKWRTLEERKALPCMEPLRADVLLAGALILWRMLEIFKFQECTVSTRGLRYGVLNAGIAHSK